MNRYCLSLTFLLALASPAAAQPNGEPNDCNMGWAVWPRGDPRNPDVFCLPEFGEMTGVGAQYGNNIWPLGDLNRDLLQDWAIGHNLDTFYHNPPPQLGGSYPREILLYHGRRGRLPDPFDYERIGPTEVGSVSWLVASGDWDNSGSTDLAVAYRIIGDTSYGDTTGHELTRLVVFWGDSSGRYSIQDTTRLECGTQMWAGPDLGLSYRTRADSVASLLIWTYRYGFTNSAVVPIPRLIVYRGHDHKKWGRDGVGRLYDWSWWGAPVFDKVIDADGDGRVDLTGHTVSPPTGPASAWVLYGQDQPYLDTTALQRVDLWTAAQCEMAIFSDVTGDRIPELVALSGGAEQNTIKVYIGLRGQRLAEQFGSGAEPPHPGQPRWWGKPWAEVWQPYRVNDFWIRNDALYDLGDADLNGVDDIWSFSYPFLIEYNSGEKTDSLIDAMVRNPGTDVYLAARANLGDIDGSRVPSIAIGTGSAIHFYKMSRELQNMTYVGRLLPPGTGPAAVRQPSERDSALELRVVPNPAHGVVNLHWPVAGLWGTATISLTDTRGRTVGELTANASSGSRTFSTSDLSPGEYFVTMSAAGRRATARFVLP